MRQQWCSILKIECEMILDCCSHVQHQMEWGLFGAIVIQDPKDPYK